MRLSFAPEVEAFRREFKSWLEANRPSAAEMAADPARSSAHVPDWARRFARRLFDAGWLVPGWPPELGGRNAGPIEQLVYLEEMARAGVPRTTNPQGLGIIAPSILDYGTPEQVRDYALPVLRGERAGCLGMSEPGAGSDLAALSTRADRIGDRFVVNGQKVWTSGANFADFCFLFCRTDPEAPKHRGISVLLVEMDRPGVRVRPLPEIVGRQHPDLNEVFFSDVEVPASQLVGRLNDGWALANGSLAHERGMVWLHSVLRLQEAATRLLEAAPRALERMGPTERAASVDQIVRCWADAQAARCLGYRGFAKLVRGGTAPEQALMKVMSSEAGQRLSLVAAEVEGAGGLDVSPQAPFFQGWTPLELYFSTFGGTISAGSSEIQRNIIAEKVLGLPRG
jgi:alkylation response protein AidB-like acyl-CoA dehydrogenase